MRLAILAAAAAFVLAAPPASADSHKEGMARSATDPALQAALAAPARADDRARDAYRHPGETLAFFRVQPGMTVVDYMPAGGWYTRLLVPYLGAQGRYVGLMPNPDAADNDRFAAYFAGLPDAFRKEAPGWSLTGAPMTVGASGSEAIAALDGQVDRAMIFREMHNLWRSGALTAELARIRALLKPDGMLGIVQHRARADAPAAYTDGNKGYLRQDDVIALVQAHGFELMETSEVNANPADTADHPDGVWELPPTLRSKREDLRSVGESDRMTLLFRKRA